MNLTNEQLQDWRIFTLQTGSCDEVNDVIWQMLLLRAAK